MTDIKSYGTVVFKGEKKWGLLLLVADLAKTFYTKIDWFRLGPLLYFEYPYEIKKKKKSGSVVFLRAVYEVLKNCLCIDPAKNQNWMGNGK